MDSIRLLSIRQLTRSSRHFSSSYSSFYPGLRSAVQSYHNTSRCIRPRSSLATAFNPTVRLLSSSSCLGSGLSLGRQVREAINNNEPIVALESTVITHGMPQPYNLSLAIDLERRVMESVEGQRVVAATVGIVKGKLVVGLSNDELEFLAKVDQSKPIKASRRDIPIAMAFGLSGGTTVAATMAIAASVGKAIGSHSSPIKVFATGGIGGVHRGGQDSMDVSADLFEFSRSPICVVSSGFKSFLDTRRSLEYLETIGCTVMSLVDGDLSMNKDKKWNRNGNWNENKNDQLFPAFYCRQNLDGVRSPNLVNNLEEAARVLYYCLEASQLVDQRGALLAVPIPKQFSLDNDELVSSRALSDAAIRDIEAREDLEGKEKTPLILEQLNRVTAGKSLKANIELLNNNALVGARLACEYAKITNRSASMSSTWIPYEHRQRADQRVTKKSASKPCEIASDTLDSKQEQHIDKANSIASRGPTSEGYDENLAEGSERDAYRTQAKHSQRNQVIVVGCTMIDMHVSTRMDEHFKNNPQFSGVTFEGNPHLSLGGVGRNLAVALEYLGCEPIFITGLGNDELASFAKSSLLASGFSGSTRLKAIEPTIEDVGKLSSCFALVLLDSLTGQCEYVIANLAANRIIDKNVISKYAKLIGQSKLLVSDANLTSEAFENITKLCHQYRVPIFLEPTDCLALPRIVSSIQRLNESGQADLLSSLQFMSPNMLEFRMLCQLFESKGNSIPSSDEASISLEMIREAADKFMRHYMPQLKCLLITMDKAGVLVALRRDKLSRELALDDVKLLPQPTVSCSHNYPNDNKNPSTLAPRDNKAQLELQLRARVRQDNDQEQPSSLGVLETEFSPIGPQQTETEPEPDTDTEISIKHFEVSRPIECPVSASGAGDSFAASFVFGMLNGLELAKCIELGFQGSRLALQDQDAISNKLRQIKLPE